MADRAVVLLTLAAPLEVLRYPDCDLKYFGYARWGLHIDEAAA